MHSCLIYQFGSEIKLAVLLLQLLQILIPIRFRCFRSFLLASSTLIYLLNSKIQVIAFLFDLQAPQFLKRIEISSDISSSLDVSTTS